METLQGILSKAGLDISARIVLLRVNPDKAVIATVNEILLPVAFRRRLYEECKPFIDEFDYVVCFLEGEQDGVIFEGVYSATKDGKLEKHMDFELLGGYPVIKWKPETPSHFKLGTQPLVIQSLKPTRYYHPLNPKSDLWTTKSLTVLDEAVRKPYQDWRELLTQSKGTFHIIDFLTGKMYVGKATGKNGLWEEFENFVKTKGHGNYPELLKLTKDDPDHAYHFSFQIGRLCLNDNELKEAQYEMELLASSGFTKLTKEAIAG